jgi:hypothetical protein
MKKFSTRAKRVSTILTPDFCLLTPSLRAIMNLACLQANPVGQAAKHIC